MSLDTLLEAARYIEKRELHRQRDCLYLEQQRIVLDSLPPRLLLTKAQLKEYGSSSTILSSVLRRPTSVASDTSGELSSDSDWSPLEPYSTGSETDTSSCRLSTLQTRKRLWSNSSRASENLSQTSKKHKPSPTSEIYSSIHCDSGDDRLLDEEVNSDEHSVDGVIGSLRGEVERLNRTLLEMQSRMSGVFAPLSNRVDFRTNRSSTPRSEIALNRKRSEKPRQEDDEVPIGSGKTLIPRHVYNQIDWNSYTIATRKLLMAVFPRSTLATHSLTGKASPAFQAKPAKLRLDTRKVNDIVMTVVERCGVREGLVRSCITTKCADENKMFKMRLKKKANSEYFEENKQNIPPEY